ncbi:MAG: DUF1826 domain-containing protein [Pseudomonadota bacterium]
MQATVLETDDVAAPMGAVTRLSNLRLILDDAVDGVILDRSLPSFVTSSLAAMRFEPAMGDRFCLSPNQTADCMTRLFAEWGFAPTAAQRWIAEDIQSLAMEFAQTLAIKDVILRVEVIADDACRKFHRDAIRARLICTYTGPGTEYGVASPGEEPATIERVPTGAPVILKGKAWPGAGGLQLKHRSPPIEGLGLSRFVVVIDEATTSLL